MPTQNLLVMSLIAVDVPVRAPEAFGTGGGEALGDTEGDAFGDDALIAVLFFFGAALLFGTCFGGSETCISDVAAALLDDFDESTFFHSGRGRSRDHICFSNF